jgi:6-phosphogluconolactonase/glucosamine-6-phosphate isomerase/deaminase
VSASTITNIRRRAVGQNLWLSTSPRSADEVLAQLSPNQITYEVLESEESVGRAMLEEIEAVARHKNGDIVIVLLGGRGAQALHRLLGRLACTNEKDDLLKRLRIFTQDALAPMRMNNAFSFVRDFERLLGPDFFAKVKSFSSFETDGYDLELDLSKYIETLEIVDAIDIFFLGLGPEAHGASHLAYIKPGSGAAATDVAGMIPISSSILEHHIKKFKVGGSAVTEVDEAECRAATHILTLGPAAILKAKRVVQSIVDAGTAPQKRESYRRFLKTDLSRNDRWAEQLNENPGLWLRFHPNVRSLILSDVLETA